MNRKQAPRLLPEIILLGMLVTVPALAGTRIEKTFDLGPGGRFVLDSKSGSVTVTGSAESGARIVITSKRDDLESRMDFDFDSEPGLVKVTANRTGGERSFFGLFRWNENLSLKYEIRVPVRTDLEIDTGGGSVKVSGIEGDARLETSGGSVGVADLRGTLEAHTSGGSITLESTTGDARVGTSGGGIRASDHHGTLHARTSGGGIEVAEVSGDVDVGTSGGSVRVSGASGRVDAKTSGGSIDVRFATGNDRGGHLKTSGGGIRVALDSAVNLDLDAHTSGGRVRSDLPVTVIGEVGRSSLRGSLGSGGESLNLRCSGGSITIEAL